jgi:hypothetical protein
VKSYEKLLDAMAHIGDTLPRFHNYVEIFQNNDTIKQVLCLFYRDILDFNATVLNFFRRKSKFGGAYTTPIPLLNIPSEWRVFFESLWPLYAGKFFVIRQNMERHRLLLDNQATLSHITEAHAARVRAYREYEDTYEFQQRQDFATVKSSLNPQLYDDELERLRVTCTVESGKWLKRKESFSLWSDTNNLLDRLLWLEGIPGSGNFPPCSLGVL